MSVDHSSAVVPLVTRWTRYQHDRAYVKRGESDLGYRDLKTGAVVCQRPADRDLVVEATAAMYDHARTVARAKAYVPKHGAPELPALKPAVERPRPTTAAPSLPDRDLALNRPGQAVRQVAQELRDAAPVRTFLARVVGAKTDERAHRIGADGEVEVARRLAKLGDGWHVLHAVPVGDRDSDIDHVVIGPAGVFTVNAKHHPQASVWVGGDVVKVNGHNQPYVRNSRFEAQRAATLLSAAAGFDIEVRGVVAVVGAQRGFTVKAQPADGRVTALARKDVDGWLRGRPAVLGQPSVARIYEVARHLSTWQPRTVRNEILP